MLLSIGYWKLGFSLMNVRTLEEALEYVQPVGVLTQLSGKAKGVPALRDDVDLPKKGGGRTKWGAKAEAIWAWKNELPEVYPDEIYCVRNWFWVSINRTFSEVRSVSTIFIQFRGSLKACF